MPRPLCLSIQDHLLDWRAVAWPIDWPAVFGREAPLALEIGFGNGQFLYEQALEHPERDHVGIELSWSGATRLFKRLDRDRVTNARAILIDADVALRRLFRPESLEEVFVNHPCPWPKARHVRRRLLQPEGLQLLADRMRTGSQLTVATDHAEYAAWLTEILMAQETLASRHPTPEVAEIPGRRPTKYQLKAMAVGVPIHFFQWIKQRQPPDVAPPPEERESSMPTMTLRGSATTEDPFAGFEPSTLRETHRGVFTLVRLVSAYRRVGGVGPERTWMVEALAQEDGLRQDFAVLVVERRKGELLLKLAELGRPHPTYGVKRAVYAVGAWLLSRHAQLEVGHESVGEAARELPEDEPGGALPPETP